MVLMTQGQTTERNNQRAQKFLLKYGTCFISEGAMRIERNVG